MAPITAQGTNIGGGVLGQYHQGQHQIQGDQKAHGQYPERIGHHIKVQFLEFVHLPSDSGQECDNEHRSDDGNYTRKFAHNSKLSFLKNDHCYPLR